MIAQYLPALPVLVFFIAGFILRKTGLLTGKIVGMLLKIIYVVMLPALVLSTVPGVRFTAGSRTIPLAAVAVICSTFIASAAATRSMGLGGRQKAVVMTGAIIMNLGITLPFIRAYFGNEGLARLFLFDAPNVLSAFTLAWFIACRYGEGQGGPMLKKALLSPPLWAIGASLAMQALSLRPAPAMAMAFRVAGEPAIPLILIALGASIRFPIAISPALAAGIVLRMGVGLSAGLIASALLGLEGIDRAVVLICSTAPAGYNTLTFASVEKLDIDLAASLVAVTMLIGLILFPLLVMLV